MPLAKTDEKKIKIKEAKTQLQQVIYPVNAKQ